MDAIAGHKECFLIVLKFIIINQKGINHDYQSKRRRQR